MKVTIALTITLAALACAYADDAPVPKVDIAAEILKTKVQEFSRALVELKLQEVKLSHATPVDSKLLALVQAQEAAVNQELLHLAIGPLEARLEEALKTYSEGHRVVIELRKEIERRTSEMREVAPEK
jgi:hypothetical protein